jgi:hypothetical protein
MQERTKICFFSGCVSDYVLVQHALKFAFFSQQSLTQFSFFKENIGLWQAFCQLGARGNENSELSCQQQLVTPVQAFYDENHADILLSFVVASPSLTNAIKKECSQVFSE